MNSLVLKNTVYNWLKPITTTVLPGVAALYIALAALWSFPNPEQVAGTIAAINTFLGLFVMLSSVAYNKSDDKYDGDMNLIDRGPGEKKVFQFELNVEPEEFERKRSVLFQVKHTNSE